MEIEHLAILQDANMRETEDRLVGYSSSFDYFRKKREEGGVGNLRFEVIFKQKFKLLERHTWC
jgi:hypothetical protein